MEFRRQWTVAAFFIPIGLGALTTIMLVPMALIQPVYDFARNAAQINLSMVVPFAAALFCGGIISIDVKEGWLRTLLIRPITRQQYLLIKLAAAFSSVVITIVVAGVIPNIAVGAFFAKGVVRYEIGPILVAHTLFLLQALLIIGLLVFFSCWMPGIFNMVLLAAWYIAAASIGSYLQSRFWSSEWLMLLRDFLFPSGFTSALEMILGNAGTPTSELAWGFAALGFSFALAFWSVTRIEVDKSSE
ncbi:MAG TPA: hypothetical protein DEP53_03785 [Bacteroidetes bacterium]|nr:hypothetical protein [Bacteroidota bacterium]